MYKKEKKCVCVCGGGGYAAMMIMVYSVHFIGKLPFFLSSPKLSKVSLFISSALSLSLSLS